MGPPENSTVPLPWILLFSFPVAANYPSTGAERQQFLQHLSDAAIERTHHTVRYDPAYVWIPYPGGDVPADTGVCTDEVIRSYRALGIDLQKEVHEDMQANFWKYPNHTRWTLLHTDTNIDHRRVPNLMAFFERKGETLPLTNSAADYHPGDLVTWDLGGGVPHIGIVVDRKSLAGRYLVVSQYRTRSKSRRRPIRLENHWPLPLFRSAPLLAQCVRTTNFLELRWV